MEYIQYPAVQLGNSIIQNLAIPAAIFNNPGHGLYKGKDIRHDIQPYNSLVVNKLWELGTASESDLMNTHIGVDSDGSHHPLALSIIQFAGFNQFSVPVAEFDGIAVDLSMHSRQIDEVMHQVIVHKMQGLFNAGYHIYQTTLPNWLLQYHARHGLIRDTIADHNGYGQTVYIEPQVLRWV